MILTAAVCLLVSKRGSYIMGLVLSGYIVVDGLILFNRRSISLIEVWKYVRDNHLNIYTQWEMQFFVAFIIFSATIIYLVGDELLMKSKTFVN